MHKYLIKPLIVLLSWSVLSGCEIINPDEEQPAFVRIERPLFSAAPLFGNNSHEIVSGWVYYNSRLIGVFDLPVNLPVLHDGSTRISVEAGVVADGQRATRTNYEIFSRYDSTLNLTRGQSYSITPRIKYHPNTQARLDLAFEELDQGIFTVNAPYSITRVVNVPTHELYFPGGGSGFGIIRGMIDTTNQIRMTSINGVTLAQMGRPVFAEFDLNSNTVVEIGLEVTRNGQTNFYSEILIAPTNGWKKFYINLINEVNVFQDPTATYKLIFLANASGSGSEYVATDNIRLVQLP